MEDYKPKIFVPSFSPKDHIYKNDGDQEIPSVTQILKEALGLYQYKHSGASYAATRGTMVHRAAQLLDEHDLDESTIDPVITPYLEQYKLAKKHHKVTVEANELMRFHPTLGYAGQIDAIMRIEKRGLWDIKTGKPEKWHCFQTALYAGMVQHELGNLDRYCLYLKPDSFKLVQHTCPTDFRDARILLADSRIEKKDIYTDDEICIIEAANTIRLENGYKRSIRGTK